MSPSTATHDRWTLVSSAAATALSDARRQLHHAAQFCTALGISYLPKQADDSHTNLGWDAAHGALSSRGAAGSNGLVAVGVRAADLALVVTRAGNVVATMPLHGLTIAGATELLRAALAAEGLDAARYTLERHYEIPAHPVAMGAAFDASDADAFVELSRWLGNGAIELDRVAHTVLGASEVRVWPHHFDLATLVSLPGGASTGVGLEPGDQYYDEPYFYVNVHPQPAAARATAMPLRGGGIWHTHEWIGAVLPGSRVRGGATAQQAQVRAYLDSALAACRQLATD